MFSFKTVESIVFVVTGALILATIVITFVFRVRQWLQERREERFEELRLAETAAREAGKLE